MAETGWTAQVAAAAGVAAGTGAAQLGLGYGLGVVEWPAVPAAESVWLGSLGWATWIAASSTVFGAVIAGRLGRAVGGPWRFALAVSAAVGALLTVALIALPARAAVRTETFAPQTIAAGYAVIGVLLGLIIAYWAVVSRPVAANLIATAVWLWSLAVAAVMTTIFWHRPSATYLSSWQFFSPDTPEGQFGIIFWPSALLTLLAAFAIGIIGVLSAIRRGELGVGAATSGAVGPLLVAAAFFVLAPQLTGNPGPLQSAYLIAPYAVLAGLAGSAFAVAVGQRQARPATEPGNGRAETANGVVVEPQQARGRAGAAKAARTRSARSSDADSTATRAGSGRSTATEARRAQSANDEAGSGRSAGTGAGSGRSADAEAGSGRSADTEARRARSADSGARSAGSADPSTRSGRAAEARARTAGDEDRAADPKARSGRAAVAGKGSAESAVPAPRRAPAAEPSARSEPVAPSPDAAEPRKSFMDRFRRKGPAQDDASDQAAVATGRAKAPSSAISSASAGDTAATAGRGESPIQRADSGRSPAGRSGAGRSGAPSVDGGARPGTSSAPGRSDSRSTVAPPPTSPPIAKINDPRSGEMSSAPGKPGDRPSGNAAPGPANAASSDKTPPARKTPAKSTKATPPARPGSSPSAPRQAATGRPTGAKATPAKPTSGAEVPPRGDDADTAELPVQDARRPGPRRPDEDETR